MKGGDFIKDNYFEIDTRINIIYYLDNNENIKERKIYQFQKLKILEVVELFNSQGMKDFTILKIILEEIKLMIPVNEVKKYIIKGVENE